MPSGTFGVSSKAPLGTIQGPGPAVAGPPPPPAQDPEEARFREVFQQFVATKEQCGEPTEALTFEAFAAKLRQNEDAVRQKTGCEKVDFKAYIKDGQAALKASPIR